MPRFPGPVTARKAADVYGYGSSLASRCELRGNAFFSAVSSATPTTSSTTTYGSNFYGGTKPPAGDVHPVTGDPKFADPGVTGPVGTPATGPRLDTALGFAPHPGPVLIDRGTAIPDNSGQDYRGATLYAGKPDIGAVEYHS